MELWIGALNLGFLYSFMTMGVFITFRVHDFPDITVDGSFTTGAAVAAVLMARGVNPFMALLAACGAGAIAGGITALIHTRLNINGLLAGILVMTGLYSINLHVMGRSNIPLLNQTTLFTWLERINPGLHGEVWITVALLAILGLFWWIMSLFFKTDMGVAMRVTGNNPAMAAAAGINVGRMTVFGVALANGLVGVSGALVAQYQGFADIGMGIGTILIGLAAVIIGESVLRTRSMVVIVLSVIVGSVIFRLMIAAALYVGMNPIDLKLLTAAFVLVTLVVSKRIGSGPKKRGPLLTRLSDLFTGRRISLGLAGIAVVLLGWAIFKTQVQEPSEPVKKTLIGMVQVADHGLLNITRDSFVEEMKRLGYGKDKPVEIMAENANGDLATVNTILDKFLHQKVDVVVPISTACTQAAIHKVKDRPVVFATVANPFVIEAGESETVHLRNVTGVYGWVPMEKTLEVVRQLIPGKITIGTIWDPAHANSVFNVENLKKAAAEMADVTVLGATISGSSEVYEAARSLVNKGIDAFVLAPDNIVYSAFESVVKAARSGRIPIFMSDVERLSDGALATLGYDYTLSGIQAARLVDRILKGEDPAKIPFERYKKITFGLNLDAAGELGISIPDDLLAKATKIHGRKAPGLKRADKVLGGKEETFRTEEKPEKRVVLFTFSDHDALMETARGVKDQLKKEGRQRGFSVTVDVKSAQNEFYLAQSISQDIVRQQYDLVITLSTPLLQVMARANQTVPHVFGAVTDPYQSGVAKSPGDHPPNITGLATSEPVETTIQVMRELFPHARRIGMIWNPAEACSEVCTIKARKAAAANGFELMESTVSSPAEIGDALRSLLSKKIDLFYTSGDNTVASVQKTINQILRKDKIPCFTNVPSDVESGAFVSIGADFYEVGQEIARVAGRVIAGESPKGIPIKEFAPEKIIVNVALAEEYGIRLPRKFLEQAAGGIGKP